MRSGIPLARLLFRRCRRWRCWYSGSGWPARSCRAWALIARVTWPTGRTLVHVLVTGLLTQALQFICSVPGADARRARRAGRRGHLDESRRHRPAGGGVPRRGPDLDAGRRLGPRRPRGAGRLRGTAGRHRRSRHRRAAAARRAGQPRRGRGLSAAVLLRRGLPATAALQNGVALLPVAVLAVVHAVHGRSTRGRRRARWPPSCCSTRPCA